MSTPLPHLAARIFGQPLMIHKAKLDTILSVLGPRFNLDLPAIKSAAVEGRRTDDGYLILPGGVAYIPIHGTLVQRADWIDAMSGLTSYDRIWSMFDAAIDDQSVTEIMLDIDSPGGEVATVFDLSDRIYQARGQKFITARVNESAFSAAYAIASAADRIVMPRTGGVGSVGVIATHIDESAADEQDGYRITHVYAGSHKADLSSHQPLSDEARGWLQTEVDRLYGIFVETVARNRGLSVDAVMGTDARIYMGQTAITAGLADAIEPAATTLGRLVARQSEEPFMASNPQNLEANLQAPPLEAAPSPVATQPAPEPDPRADAAEIMDACAAAGMPDISAAMVREGLTPEQAKDRIKSAGTIRDLCAAARQTGKADGFIRAGLNPDQVRARLFDSLVAQDEATHTESRTVPGATATSAGSLNPNQIYATRRQAVPGR